MNKYLSLVLMQRLIGLPYIDKFGGVVQVIQKVIPIKDGQPIIKRIPVSAVHQAPETCGITEATVLHFIPESKLKGMLYFEDMGVTPDKQVRHSGINFYRSRMRLIVWVNQKKLTQSYDIALATKMMNQVIGLIAEKQNDNDLTNLSVDVVSVPPATAQLFGAYDYDEHETQFLMPPYDFFGLDIECRFGVAKHCPVPIVVNPSEC